MPSCPLCQTNLNIDIHSTLDSAIVKVNLLDMTENLIRDALLRYWRWVTEGYPTAQCYYDSYHDNIKFIEENIYSFRIQIYDSPTGDTWLRGKVRVDDVCDIKILEKETVYQ